MTYQPTWDEYRVWLAVGHLVSAGRTANTSQVARWTGLSRSKVDAATRTMSAQHYLRDAGTGNAHHWRHTSNVPAVAAPSRHREVAPSDSAAMNRGHDDVAPSAVTSHA